MDTKKIKEQRWFNNEDYKALLQNFQQIDTNEFWNFSEKEFYELRTIDVNKRHIYIDLESIDLSHRQFGEVYLGEYLKNANLSHCHFNATLLQNAFAYYTNFSHSVFEGAQMSPFFGVGADFSHCTIKKSYTISFMDKTDFTNANFSFVKCRDTAMNFNIFDRANFSNASFIDCEMHSSTFKKAIFREAFIKRCDFNNDEPYGCDFRGADLTNAKFIQCDFRNAIFDDTEQSRHIIENGFNKNIDSIVWEK